MESTTQSGPKSTGAYVFKKKKKFKEETTPEKRLSDRWDQQVFFIKKTYPHAEGRISAIMKTYTPKKGEFSPSEEALIDLANLYTDLKEVTL